MTRVIDKNVIDLRNQKPEHDTPLEKIEVGTSQKTGVLYEWRAQEFMMYRKDIAWIAGLALFVIGLTIYFTLTKNYLGAILVILMGILTGVWATRKPNEVAFQITSLGISVGSRLFPFERLKSFWIIYEPRDIKEVVLHIKQVWNPHLYLNIGSANPVEIRKALLRFLPEKEEQESLANVIARRLGF